MSWAAEELSCRVRKLSAGRHMCNRYPSSPSSAVVIKGPRVRRSSSASSMRAACADTARNWPFANLNGPTASGGLVYSLVARAAGDQKARSWMEPSRNASARCASSSARETYETSGKAARAWRNHGSILNAAVPPSISLELPSSTSMSGLSTSVAVWPCRRTTPSVESLSQRDTTKHAATPPCAGQL
eukprot:scaffold18893_cov53-Phaeocystis_antarctica.AAC.2